MIWDEAHETMSRQALQDLQVQRLRALVARV